MYIFNTFVAFWHSFEGDNQRILSNLNFRLLKRGYRYLLSVQSPSIERYDS